MSDNSIVKQLQNTIKQLKCENESLKYGYNQLECENGSLYIIIKELESKLILYDNPHTPPSLKRDESLKKSPNGNNNGKPGRKNGHKGETRPIVTPTEFIEFTEEKCPYCETKLRDPCSIQTKIIEDIPEPQPVIVTEYKIARYNCPKCKKEVIASDSNIEKKADLVII